MPQLFHPATNTIFRAVPVGVLLLAIFGGWAWYHLVKSQWNAGVKGVHAQPVPFSHQHHVAGLGLDCRYCHTAAAESRFAGIPPTKTCMTCHSQIWRDTPLLEPVRNSWYTDRPLHWNRVHDLPDYVYFNHAIHVNGGIGCTTCHGPVNQMPLTYRGASLQMRWCLDCHRHVEQYLRPRNQVFNPDYQPPANQLQLGTQLTAQYHIDKDAIQRCSTCHR